MNRDFTQKRVRWLERCMEGTLLAAAAVAVGVVLTILAIVVTESARFFAQVPVVEFLTETRWTPLFEDPHYGIAPLLSGTFMSTLVALAVAVPLGLLVAIYLSEFASARARETIKPILELLAAVPTVVYGYFALLFVTPFLQAALRPLGVQLPSFNLLSAGLVMGLMIVPYIASLSEDAMRAVPRALREGSFAMGATRLETAFSVVVPAAVSGVVGAVILGMSRAIGETMIVAVAGGSQPQIVSSPAQQGATVTAFIAQVAQGDLPWGTLQYNSIFAAGLALLVLTLMFNFVAFWLQRRYREAY
ncbi:MAG: phosphate ABC transporter permease subunit PstC [Hyphomonadaceae bacterium]|nr:phosphate ABC transporter permease subunit PstC [Hyphomonadaceae bacterium]